jgi:5'-3' exonuclease
MTKTYILVDTANTFSRARYSKKGTLDERVGLSLHTILHSIRKAWKDFQGDHVVFCLEGRSWRKDVYKPYKANRAEARAAMTVKEQEEDLVFWETFDRFQNFIETKTNATTLRDKNLEADDLIGGWIQHHPNDKHIIISTDSDFFQLISPNVSQYNGVTGTLITHDAVYNEKNQRLKFSVGSNCKLKIDEVDETFTPDPSWMEYSLFLKCIRGDSNDNIFSAYPGVRIKGTKNKVGLQEAFSDRQTRGYAWNNLMLQRWVDHEGIEHKVIDDYNRNRMLCDLSAQPEHIRTIIKETIDSEIYKNKNNDQVGIWLLKFCSQFDLEKISEQAQSFAEPLNARYA